jgi:membrane-bound metal-dependent hydrolase YbcI (DUF457 family)
VDSLTHLLVGHAMGAVASSAAHPYGAAAYWAALIGNSLPDIDVPLSLLLRRDIKLHRTFTHTLLGAMLLSSASAMLMRPFFPEVPLFLTFGFLLLGCLVHMGMDCLNLFGARPFWPMSHRAYEYGILHILDPILLVLLGIPALLTGFGKLPLSVLVLAFFAIFPYVAYRVFSARKLLQRLRVTAPLKVRIIPWFSAWRYVMETTDTVEMGSWQRGRPVLMKQFAKQESPWIQASMTDPRVADFLRGAEYPYACVEEDSGGPIVVWGDMLRQLRADFRPLKVRIQI